MAAAGATVASSARRLRSSCLRTRCPVFFRGFNKMLRNLGAALLAVGAISKSAGLRRQRRRQPSRTAIRRRPQRGPRHLQPQRPLAHRRAVLPEPRQQRAQLRHLSRGRAGLQLHPGRRAGALQRDPWPRPAVRDGRWGQLPEREAERPLRPQPVAAERADPGRHHDGGETAVHDQRGP